MHRSGTSFCVRALQRHGALLPTNLLPAANDNPEGFLEPAELVSLNERLLHSVQALWDASWPVQPAVTPLQRNQFGAELQSLVEEWCSNTDPNVQSTASNQLMALKDPRLCRILPLLSPYLTPHTFRYGIAVIREPNAVIASLLERNGDDMSPLKGFALWMRYNLDMVQGRNTNTEIGEWPIISFEALIKDPLGTFQPILQQWQQHGFIVEHQPKQELICRQAKPRPNYLEVLPQQWMELGQTFHSFLQQSKTLREVPEAVIQAVEQWLESTPELNHQLLAHEAQRRAHLGAALAAERLLSWRNQ